LTTKKRSNLTSLRLRGTKQEAIQSAFLLRALNRNLLKERGDCRCSFGRRTLFPAFAGMTNILDCFVVVPPPRNDVKTPLCFSEGEFVIFN